MVDQGAGGPLRVMAVEVIRRRYCPLLPRILLQMWAWWQVELGSIVFTGPGPQTDSGVLTFRIKITSN